MFVKVKVCVIGSIGTARPWTRTAAEAEGEALPSVEAGIDDHNSNYDVMLLYNSPWL